MTVGEIKAGWQSGLMHTIGDRETGESSFGDSNSSPAATFVKIKEGIDVRTLVLIYKEEARTL